MNLKETLESELADPGEALSLTADDIEAIIELETTRVEHGIGDAEHLGALVALLAELRAEGGLGER